MSRHPPRRPRLVYAHADAKHRRRRVHLQMSRPLPISRHSRDVILKFLIILHEGREIFSLRLDVFHHARAKFAVSTLVAEFLIRQRSKETVPVRLHARPLEVQLSQLTLERSSLVRALSLVPPSPSSSSIVVGVGGIAVTAASTRMTPIIVPFASTRLLLPTHRRRRGRARDRRPPRALDRRLRSSRASP